MFPFQDPGEWLSSYHWFVCISSYTEAYTRLRWGRDLRTEVVFPCADPVPESGLPRERTILSLGRFNWAGHTKNQGVLVDAFADCLSSLPRGWRLVLAGKINDEQSANREEMEKLRERCSGLPIAFEVNVSGARKRELLSTASLYWHATGVGGSEPADAARMEHFGIAVVEAMGSGAIPLAFARGGPREIIAHARTGFLYRNLVELKTFTLCLAADPALAERFRAAGHERARLFGRPGHDQRMARIIREVTA